MIQLVFFSEFVKVLTPYIRKSLLMTLEPFECLFLNSIVVLCLCLILIGYKMLVENHKMSNTVQKFSSLSNTQYVFALLIGMATVLASMVVLTFDKHYNTPLINTTIFKIASVIMLLFVGVVVFKERYDYKQIIGIMLVIVGGVLVFHKSDILTEAK